MEKGKMGSDIAMEKRSSHTLANLLTPMIMSDPEKSAFPHLTPSSIVSK